jgi:GntR family transcriptional regulator
VLDSALPTPLYHQLAEELSAQVRGGAYAPGQKIPSEHELATRYGIGRPTVRQATDSLIQRGMLVRRRGSGTFVRNVPAPVDLFSLAGTLVSFDARGIAVDARLVGRPRVSCVEAGDREHPLAGRDATRIVRVSSVAGEPVLLEMIDFDAAHFPGFARLSLRGRSLSEVVDSHYRMRPLAADQSFRIDHLSARHAALLDVTPRAPVLRVDRTLHFPRAEAAVFARMFCRQSPVKDHARRTMASGLVFSQRIGATQHA